MANSTTNLDTISATQAQKEVSVNELLDAASPSAALGRHASACVGLTWAYYGGTILVGDTPTQIANGTVSLTASNTNYLYVDSSGDVVCSTSPPSGWPGPLAGDAIALYQIVAGSSSVTSYTDYRLAAATRGPAGPIGATGAPGADGAPGPAGAPGTAVSGLIDGMTPVWVSTTQLGATPGAAYIESLGDILSGSPANITPSSPSSSTWYHVYVYSSGGTPTLEASTTAPVAFASPTGTARSKTSDTSRRYLYSAKTDGSGNFYRFAYIPGIGVVHWVGAINASPFRVLSGGSATSSTSVDASAVAPTTASAVLAELVTSVNTVSIFAASGDVTVSSTNFQIATLTAGSSIYQKVVGLVNCSSTQTLSYCNNTGGGGTSIDIHGYVLSR